MNVYIREIEIQLQQTLRPNLQAFTTTFLTFSNSRKPWPKVQKPLPKLLSDGFLGVGYTAVAFSNRQRFFTF
jgi:hypothetical protein